MAAEILRLDGALTVARAEDIASAIARAFEPARPLVIDLGAATELDVTFLQILVAAQRHAASRNIRVATSGNEQMIETERARCGLPRVSASGVQVLPDIIKEAA